MILDRRLLERGGDLVDRQLDRRVADGVERHRKAPLLRGGDEVHQSLGSDPGSPARVASRVGLEEEGGLRLDHAVHEHPRRDVHVDADIAILERGHRRRGHTARGSEL